MAWVRRTRVFDGALPEGGAVFLEYYIWMRKGDVGGALGFGVLLMLV